MVQHVAAHEIAAEHDKAISALMKRFEGEGRQQTPSAGVKDAAEQELAKKS